MRDIKAESKDPDLRVQLDVFEEQKESDESQVKLGVNFVLKALGISASCGNLQSFQFYPWGHFYDQMFCRLYLIKTNGPSDLNLMSRTSKPLAISMTIGIMTTTTIMIFMSIMTIMIFMATNDHPCDRQTNGPHDVDLSSHLDVFYTVYNRVQDTPQVKSEDY